MIGSDMGMAGFLLSFLPVELGNQVKPVRCLTQIKRRLGQ